MASEVDICNLALSHFGQDASISSISPPDGSAEAEHARRFYPIARNEMLEAHPWTFATKRVLLAEQVNDRDDWAYRYALPADCLKPRRVLPDGYTDTENDGVTYEWEGASLYTNEATATLVYTYLQTDTTKFSPLFVIALSYLLASYLSGPIAKDPSGRTQNALRAAATAELGKARMSNANASTTRATYKSIAERSR